MRHSPIHKLAARTLADVTPAEDDFRADFEITDKYQAFSAELVRLSLLGIAGYGFLLSNFVLANGTRSEFFAQMASRKLPLGIGLICLGIATAGALAHRFYSTDCLSHQVTILRLLKRADREGWTDEEKQQNEDRLARERRSQGNDLRRCRILLIWSSVLLVCGAAAVVMTFALVLFS